MHLLDKILYKKCCKSITFPLKYIRSITADSVSLFSIIIIYCNKIAQSNLVLIAPPSLVAEPCIADVHNCSTIFARWWQCARPSNRWFLRPTAMVTPNGSLIGSAIFAQYTSVTNWQNDDRTRPVRTSRLCSMCERLNNNRWHVLHAWPQC